MALKLELAQTVAVGPFNPHIITPEWLVRCNVVPNQEVNVRLAPVIDGAAFRFGHLEWQVDPRRLIVACQTTDDDCGQFVSKVLQLLPHTPVRAVGHNFHFVSSREEWGDKPLPMLGRQTFEDAEEVRWTGVFRRGEVRVEMTIGRSGNTVVVLFNHHRNTDPRRIEQAEAAAGLFLQDYEASLAMLTQEVMNA